MEKMELKTLFSPCKIGNVEIINRIMRSALWVSRASEDGFVTDEYIKFYSEFAAGGVGLLVPGTMMVDPAAAGIPKAACLYDDKYIEGQKRLVDAIHEYSDVKIAPQLNHTGNNPMTSGAELSGPSVSYNPVFKKECRELKTEEVEQIIKSFISAGSRAYQIGYDLVQLHGAHGFLLSDFVSPYANKRTDDYGGSTQKRCKILVEIYNGLRDVIGKEFPIFIKLNTQDFIPGGLSFEEGKEIVKILISTGFDAIELSSGRVNVKYSGGKTYPALTNISPDNENYFLANVKELKPIMKYRPIILMGGIKNPISAEEILKENSADLVSMGRPLLHEPDLANRWKSGDTSPAKCISCNQCFTTGIPGPVHCPVKKKADKRRKGLEAEGKL